MFIRIRSRWGSRFFLCRKTTRGIFFLTSYAIVCFLIKKILQFRKNTHKIMFAWSTYKCYYANCEMRSLVFFFDNDKLFICYFCKRWNSMKNQKFCFVTVLYCNMNLYCIYLTNVNWTSSKFDAILIIYYVCTWNNIFLYKTMTSLYN